MSVLLPLGAVQAMAEAGESPSLFSGDTALVMDLDSVEPGLDLAALAGWLPRVSCPVIGVGAAREAPAMAAACDVLLADDRALASIRARIEAAPRAAAVFVQLLRYTEGLPLEAALMAESLAYATLQAGPEYQAWLARHRADRPRQPRDEGPAVLLRQTGNAWRLTLNRASTQNAMSVEMRDALLAALATVAAQPQPGGLVMDARGAHFSTGGELSEFGTVPDAPAGHLIRQLALPGRALAALAPTARVRVHGRCVGSGIEFPAFAGCVEAHPDTVFELPELGFGLIPGAGGCVSLLRRTGRQRLARWALAGESLDAATALRWGLVDALLD
jgi:enoyl-CoA hydratase